MSDEIITNYRDARARTREALQRGVLDAASRVLVREGYTALTVRRIAEEVGASTKVIYTLFDNKDGLVGALYLTAVQRIRAALEAIPPRDDALAYLYAMSHAYRQHVLAYPNDYIILYGLSLPDFKPSEAAKNENLASFGILVRAIDQAIHSGIFAPCDLESAGKAVIALLNGMLTFEIGNYIEDPQLAAVYYTYALETLFRGMRA